MKKLGVNIDHIATLRNARGTSYPSLATAAGIVEMNGGDFITIHLREDRRHINEGDLYLLKESVTTYLNLEMATNEVILLHALKAQPYKVTLVPERREELTTEGGLNVRKNFDKIKEYITELHRYDIIVSIFVEANINDLEYFINSGAEELEIHTGHYANSDEEEQIQIIEEMKKFIEKAKNNFRICAGHGLNYHNIAPLVKIDEIEEYNIGHAIVSRALFSGLANSVREMKELIGK